MVVKDTVLPTIETIGLEDIEEGVKIDKINITLVFDKPIKRIFLDSKEVFDYGRNCFIFDKELSIGENTIKIEIEDFAGNRVSKEWKVLRVEE